MKVHTMLDTLAFFACVVVGLTMAALVAWPRPQRAPVSRVPAPRAVARCAATEYARHADSTAYIVMRANGARCRVTLPEDARVLQDGTYFAPMRTP